MTKKRKTKKRAPARKKSKAKKRQPVQTRIAAPVKRKRKAVKKNPAARRSVVAMVLRNRPEVLFYHGNGLGKHKDAAMYLPAVAQTLARALLKKIGGVKAIGVWDAKTPPAVIELDLLKKI
jgi:hypothetical protein